MTEIDLPRHWRLFDVSFIGDVADPDRATTPWSGHRWFAYDLVRWLEPRKVVELGTHWGCSFFAMAQAVMEGRLITECHAVDTWEGDPDAGFYGPEVYESFTTIVGKWFGSVEIHAHRMTFDDALSGFADDSIDLLHIDGFHSYEAVKHDFETWFPKLAPNGITLFHDVSPSSGYGSATYWEELQGTHPGFAFPHNFGLGVLFAKGTEGLEYLLSDEFTRWRAYYTEKAGNRLGELQRVDHVRMIRERDDVMASQAAMIEDRDQALDAQTRMIEDRDRALTVQTRMIEDRDQALAAQTRMIDERDQLITDQTTMIEQAWRSIADYEAQLAEHPPAQIGAGRVIKKSVKGVAKAMPEPVPTWLLRGRRKWWQMRAPAEPVEASPPSTMTSESTDESDEEAGRTGLRLSPSPGFDASFYMKFLEDPGHADASPFEHYLEIGVRAGLPPTRAALGKAAFEMSPVRGDPVVARPLSLRTLGGQDRVIRHLSQLPLESYDLVTVDFWQTLVVRNRPAESVKLESARFLAQHLLSQGKITARQHYEARLDAESRLATERKSAAGWGEYHAREALTLGIQSLVPELSEPALHEAVEATLEHEISSEIRYASLNPELAGWLSQIGANGPEVAVLSDFYLDSATLGRILASAGLEGPVPVVVSCEAGVSKAAGGQLFIDVRERFGVPADRHLHVGDNEHSDVAMQLATGGTAVLVPPPGADTEARGGPLHADEVARMFRVAVDSQPTPGPSPKVDDIHNQRDLHEHLMSRAYRAGWHFSALPTLLTVAAMERARRDGLDRVNYVSREGALLRRVHDVISDEIGVPEIRAVHLPSSRQATFAPSLDGTNDDLARMWTFYRHQSPNDFLASLGLEPSQFRTRLVAHGLEPEARIWSIWEEPAFAAFLEHKSVRSEIERALVNQRAKAEAFLAPALGDDKRSIVVDTGWRGTIQDNIARLFPDREFHGIYLGLLAFLNEQPENSTKSALGPDANSGDDVGWLEPHVGVIERLFSPPIGSTITYAGKKGLILGDGTARSALLDAFQDGVVAGASRVANAYLALGSEVADLKEAATDLMRSLVLQPNPGAADAFFSSAHSDDFGGGGLDTSVALSLALERVALRIAQGAQPPDLDDLFWSAGLRRCFAVEVALTGWW